MSNIVVPLDDKELVLLYESILLILTFPLLIVCELDMNLWDSNLETHKEVDKQPKKAKI